MSLYFQNTRVCLFKVFGDALIVFTCSDNVDAPGCGTSVVRGPTGHK